MTLRPIDGVLLTPLRKIVDERGSVMHMLREDAPHFQRFGEIYFSWVNAGVIKAWHRHAEMTLNYAVPVGRVRVVLYDDRPESPTRGAVMEIELGGDRYTLLTIPPRLWSGFEGLGSEPSMVANCATIPHRADEIERREPGAADIPYVWQRQSP
jgi:dTDP-4-dehydrorhamnose 3,5-epimerase